MISENETWVVETGDTVIQKQASDGEDALTEMERAVYCFWVIDYAIRNSGTLLPMEDLHPGAVEELKGIADSRKWLSMTRMLERSHADAEEFEDVFYRYFEEACDELRAAYEG